MRAQPDKALKLVVKPRPTTRTLGRAGFLDRGREQVGIPSQCAPEFGGSVPALYEVAVQPSTPADFDHSSGPIDRIDHGIQLGGAAGGRQ